MISLLISVVVVMVIIMAVVWIVRSAPFIEPPFKQWAVWAITVIGVLIIISMLLPFAGVHLQ